MSQAVGLAIDGRLEMSGPKGDAVLKGSGGALRLSIDNIRTAISLLALHGQLKQMTGLAPRLGGEAWPAMDIEVHGWRVARMTNGRTRPALPTRRRAL